MGNKKSIYYKAIEFLIEHNQLQIDNNTIVISYKYSGINFNPPSNIRGISIKYLHNVEKQIVSFRKNGILRILELEPVEVVKNFLRIQFNIILSIDTKEEEYDLLLNKISLSEKKAIINVAPEKKSLSLFINIEHHLFDFFFDCEKSQFGLGKHQKKILLFD